MASAVGLAGGCVYFGKPWALLVLLPITVVQVRRSRREAAVLRERFGTEYNAYRRRTWF